MSPGSIPTLCPKQACGLWRCQGHPGPAAAPSRERSGSQRPRPARPGPRGSPGAHRGRMSSWSLSSAGISASALRLAAIAPPLPLPLPSSPSPPAAPAPAPSDPEPHRPRQRQRERERDRHWDRDRQRERERALPVSSGRVALSLGAVSVGRRVDGRGAEAGAALPCPAPRALLPLLLRGKPGRGRRTLPALWRSSGCGAPEAAAVALPGWRRWRVPAGGRGGRGWECAGNARPEPRWLPRAAFSPPGTGVG